MHAAGAGPLFGVYVHWPFCVSKCPYCDFNSHVRDGVDQARWREALLRELAYYAARTAGREVTSVFFGGGTPSLMPVDTVAAVIEAIRAHWPVAGNLEVTLEANPTSVEAANFRMLRQAGVNRVSLGVQALDEKSLKFLGRAHSLDEALTAVALARQTFERFSFDLIYARPEQTVDDWTGELHRALDFAADHISLYQLTIEKGTRFFQDYRQSVFSLPDEDASAEMYEVTQNILNSAGLPGYEVSNHARPGSECRHNIAYWRYEDYVGIGPGAHGRFAIDAASPSDGKFATRAHAGPETWLARVESTSHGCVEESRVTGRDLLSEAMMMGLRLTRGIGRKRFAELTGRDPVEAVDASVLESLVGGGFIEVTPDTIRATAEGRQRLNTVLERLLA